MIIHGIKMIIQELISIIRNINIKVDAIAIILVAVVFYLCYRKTKKTRMLGEEKNLLKKQMVIALITFSYIIVIFDITLLNKGIYVNLAAKNI